MSVSNPATYIGQPVPGSTAGAPLSADASNLLVSGISDTEVNDTANDTTTSSTEAVLDSMTITPVAGKYLVLFSSWVSHNTASATATFSIYVDSTQKADSIRTAIPLGGIVIGLSALDIPVAINGVVTVNGSQAIAIKWKTSSGTATCHQRTMNIIRLS